MKQSGRKGTLPSVALAHIREQIARQIARRQIETIKTLISLCFQGQHDPDGTAWPARADGSGKPLLLTIEDALEFTNDGESIFVDCPSKPHAEFQFYGTQTIPSRMWAPSPGEPLPSVWQERVDRSVREFIAEALRAAR